MYILCWLRAPAAVLETAFFSGDTSDFFFACFNMFLIRVISCHFMSFLVISCSFSRHFVSFFASFHIISLRIHSNLIIKLFELICILLELIWIFGTFLNIWIFFEYLEFFLKIWNFYEYLEFCEQSCVLHFETCSSKNRYTRHFRDTLDLPTTIYMKAEKYI